MSRHRFVRELKSYKGTNVFNPYTDMCELYDKKNASGIRTKNLELMLDSFMNSGADSLWIGRDLGHRGGRRTGLALTDEAHLQLAGRKWGVRLSRATSGNPIAERTASVVWDFLDLIDQNIFMWNVFPFHPYESGNQLTNRNHNSQERNDGMAILEELVTLLRPQNIIAIGNDAYNCAQRTFPRLHILKVRHPSYGGERLFGQQMKDIYQL